MNNIGFAIDLGTTTIDYCLMDPADNHVIFQSGFSNPQALYGNDVINRIMTISRDASYASVLKSIVTDALLGHLQNALKKYHFGIEEVSKITICGNTTMISILLGLDVTCLGKAPFLPALKEDVCTSAGRIFGENSNLTCPVFLSGCAGAFVGGDVLAGIYYLKHKYPKEAFCDKTCLFIDFGTNGEIVLYHNQNYYGAATACGPAFENCTRKQKIYGSTTLEAIALLLASGKILSNGAFAQDGIKQCVVNQVTITSDILHNILLAKAAIAAGIETICEQADICPEDIDIVYLAGGFGFYLNLEHAVRLGLIPAKLKTKIKVVGNTSLEGAKMLLQNTFDTKLFKEKMHIFNFAEIQSYQDHFIHNMYYKPID